MSFQHSEVGSELVACSFQHFETRFSTLNLGVIIVSSLGRSCQHSEIGLAALKICDEKCLARDPEKLNFSQKITSKLALRQLILHILREKNRVSQVHIQRGTLEGIEDDAPPKQTQGPTPDASPDAHTVHSTRQASSARQFGLIARARSHGQL